MALQSRVPLSLNTLRGRYIAFLQKRYGNVLFNVILVKMTEPINRRIRALANKSVTDSLGASFVASGARHSFFGAIRLYTTGRSQTNSVVVIRLPIRDNRVDADRRWRKLEAAELRKQFLLLLSQMRALKSLVSEL